MTHLRHARLMGLSQQARLLLIVLLLLSLGVQQWAAQSHVHVVVASIQADSSEPAGETGGGTLPGHNCLWCQIASHPGSLAPPPAWSVAAATVALVASRGAFSAVAPPATALSWSWQSRGPPAV